MTGGVWKRRSVVAPIEALDELKDFAYRLSFAGTLRARFGLSLSELVHIYILAVHVMTSSISRPMSTPPGILTA
jgi:hypothetical protein